MKVVSVLLLVIGVVAARSLPHALSGINVNAIVEHIESDIKLSASPTLLQQSGDWVTVKWSGVPKPNENDWIGVYTSDVNFTATAPVKYLRANASAEWKDGKGSVRFRLINMRAPYFFTYMRKGFKKPVVAQKSSEVAFEDYNEPLQPHLAITPLPNTLALTWVSQSHTAPTLFWGTVSGDYPFNSSANSSTYGSEHMCGAPATTKGYRDPGWIHSAYLSDLESGQQYFYYFGDEDSWSEEFNFTYQAAADSINILAWGDMGTAYSDLGKDIIHVDEINSLNTTANAFALIDQTDLILHIGDISYARGFASDWESFFDQITPLSSRVPYMVGSGNHERDFPSSGSLYDVEDSGGECGVAYNMRFPFSSNAVLNTDKLKKDTEWYSFDYGPVHCVFMSTEHDFSPSSEQYVFLESDLATTDRSITPWIIFLGHRPMYIDSDYGGDPNSDQVVATALREYVEPLLVKYNVNIGLWGHHHSYQRTCPVNNQTCDNSGVTGSGLTHVLSSSSPVQVVIGMAGYDLSQNLETTQPTWLQYVNDQEWGFSQIKVNRTALSLSFFNENRELRDSFVIVQ